MPIEMIIQALGQINTLSRPQHPLITGARHFSASGSLCNLFRILDRESNRSTPIDESLVNKGGQIGVCPKDVADAGASLSGLRMP